MQILQREVPILAKGKKVSEAWYFFSEKEKMLFAM